MSADTFGKGPPIIATPNWSDEAVIESYTGFDSDDDALRLQTMQPSDRAQSTGVAGGVEIVYNRGAPYPFSLASMLFGNISGTGSWEIQAANALAELDTGPRLDTSLGFGAALHFDGGTGTADASNASWNALTSFSISARIRHDTRFLTQGIVKLAPASGAYAVLSIDGDGIVHFKRSTGGVDLTSLTPLTIGQWYRVTGTYNAGTQVATLIIDGVQAGVASSISSFVTTPHTLTISSPDSDRFLGSIDDVRLWNTGRSTGQELAVLDAEIASPPAALVGYWKMNELQGTSAANSVTGPALTVAGTPTPYWNFANRYWTSPDLESWDRTHSLFYDQASYTYQYMRVRVIDPLNTQGYLHFGRFYGSAAYQLTRGLRYGSEVLGWRDDSIRTRTPAGVGPFVRRAKLVPTRKISIYTTDKAEAYYAVDNLARLRGGSRDVLWIMEPYDEQWRHHSMIYCLDSPETDVPVNHYGLYEHSHVLEGIV